MTAADVELVVEADAEAASTRAAASIVAAVRAGGAVALSGGSTPRRAYEVAAALEPDWGHATVWLADERCVAPGDPLQNATLVEESILGRVAALPRFHPVATQLGPEVAAARYDAQIRTEGLPGLVLLGVGSDGHTASLFPHAPTLDEREALVVAAEPALAPFVFRVTLTLRAIAAVEHVVFLVTGEEKADVVRLAVTAGASRAVPASLARSAAGTTTAVLDAAAAGRL